MNAISIIMPCYNREYDLRRVLEAYDQQDTGIPLELIVVDDGSTDDSLRQQGGFVGKVLQWSRQQETLRMVDDQIGNPTWERMLAEMTAQILARGNDYIHELTGLYQLAGSGFASRFKWAQMILELDPHRQEQTVKDIFPALTTDFPTPAQRPLFSALDCSRFGHVFDLILPPWQKALRLALDEPLH